jgi:hypothetical protein
VWTLYKPACSSRSSARKQRRRVAVSEAELKKLAETAAKTGVPMTLERTGPDGTRTRVTAGGAIAGTVPADGANEWDELYDGDVQAQAR